MRIRIAVGVAYHHNAELIEKTLIEVALRNSDILHDPAPEVFLKNFGDSSIDFELLVWIDNIWKSEIISSKLRFEIKKEFDLKKITIPFPQQDIYIKELPSNRQEVRL